MKKRLIAVLTIVMMLFTMGAAQAFAEGEETGDGGAYKYKVTVYAGNQGHFADGKTWSKTYEFESNTGTIDLESLGFVLDNDKYYVRGFRQAGHDNDETTGAQTMNFTVTEDCDFEIAYGIKGNMTDYTVRYVDAAGNELHAPDTFYGKVGDKPMVAFRYIEGFLPSSYNITGTLKETGNEFVFTYNPAEGNVTVNTITNTVTGPAAPGAVAAGAAAGAPGAPGAAPAGQNIADGQTPTGTPDQVVDIDDSQSPTETPENVNDNKGPLAGIPTAAKIAGGVVILAAIAAIAAAIARRNRDDDDDEDDEE